MSIASTLPTISTRPQASKFGTLLQKYATIFTTATFAVVGLTGSLIFFHLGNAYLMGLHEWLGLAFVVAAGFHVLRHANMFTKLLKKSRTQVILAGTATLAMVWVATTALGPDTGNPLKEFAHLSTQAPIAALAQVTGENPESLAARFEAAGITGISLDQSIETVSKNKNRESRALLRLVLDGRS
ncbi:DUF4405 domain-containing protein [Magnetospira sp. QH-2]|uniref:DUF4405 domain-containing protein n=1 Tax=Magnetospira sp. (strain QH-2) TaxID=1288970 RepID=UPI0003E816BF|nr:DUF4405 domain-containing protein [Magnetospira sp. QH-2]CCQ75354.1 conserved membrane protein of unknown function [Magnetospira sp. QH-2]